MQLSTALFFLSRTPPVPLFGSRVRCTAWFLCRNRGRGDHAAFLPAPSVMRGADVFSSSGEGSSGFGRGPAAILPAHAARITRDAFGVSTRCGSRGVVGFSRSSGRGSRGVVGFSKNSGRGRGIATVAARLRCGRTVPASAASWTTFCSRSYSCLPVAALA